MRSFGGVVEDTDDGDMDLDDDGASGMDEASPAARGDGARPSHPMRFQNGKMLAGANGRGTRYLEKLVRAVPCCIS